MSDKNIRINAAILNRLILMIDGGKSIICESAADYSPYIEPGQKYIHHITEPNNVNFALHNDGTVLRMDNDNDWWCAVMDKTPLTLIFSLPKNSFMFDAVERLCKQYVGAS